MNNLVNMENEVERSHWRCCSCGSLMSCDIGGTDILQPPVDCLPRHCRNGCGVCEAATCPMCNKRRCVFCVFINPQGKEISTVGGKNLIADRFESAGWSCCLCDKSHYPQPAAGHPDTHATVVTAGGNEWHIQHTCHHDGRSEPEPPCHTCVVLNRYNEPTLLFGDITLDEEPIPYPGPFLDHFLWCGQNVDWARRIIDEHNKAVAESSEPAFSTTAQANNLRLAEAENAVEETNKILEKENVPWVAMQKAAIEAAQRRGEHGHDTD